MAFSFLFAFGVVFFLFSYGGSAARWATYPANRHLYKNGRLVNTGAIYDRRGETLLAVNDSGRKYHKDATTRRALMHLVGDSDGNVAASLQVSRSDALSGWNFFTGAYSYDASSGKDITVTVDAALCKLAYDQLDGRAGVVGVMNYHTGEVLCMTTSPSFDPEKPPDLSAPKYKDVYYNRMLSFSYAPGSIFKLVTAAAAIDCLPNAGGRVFTCDGRLPLPGGRITCMRAHGEQSLGQALTNSCNIAFATMAIEMGPDVLTRYARQAGIGDGGMRIDDIAVAGGSFDLSDASAAEIGWASVGQHTTQVNPLHFMQYVGSIAAGGRRVAPIVIRGVGSGFLDEPKVGLGRAAGDSLSKKTADALKAMMRDNVINSYGEGKLAGYNLCAKTGTAEVGGGLEDHSWFTGFLDSDKAPLCFIVLVENGGRGSGAAASIAKTVLAQAVKLM
ncbi:MAG: penicillin-binding transpeptidase domain-containing protein [Oscillospiraceae bacterium]|nr:penicillin-binding transpeptidase domain-containing protein [Oscillospiraceae bacterium]